MNNCSVCGGKLTHESRKYVCIACGRSHYINPKAAVVLVLYAKDKNSLVLARRAHDPGKGKLDFVGGFLDAGEDFETAAYRELKEETGLEKEDVGQLDYLCSFYNGYMWEGVELPTTSACFLVAIDDKKSIHPSDDVASVEYITSNQLPVGADGAWLNMDKVLQLAAQRLRSM